MFSQILTAFQGFFSRSFWFGSFLPVAVIAALHLVIYNIAFPGRIPISEWLGAGLDDTTKWFSLIIVGLVVLAYALTPFTPLVRDFLDGRRMPDWLHDWLRQDRMNGWRTANKKTSSATKKRGTFAGMKKDCMIGFWKATDTGNALKKITNKDAIRKATVAIASWREKIQKSSLPDEAIAKEAVDCLNTALSENASNLLPPHTDADLSKELARAKEELIDLITEANDEARYRFMRTASKYYRLDLYPTRVGDTRWATERYSEDAYGVDFDFIWSRIQLLLKKDENIEFLQRLRDTQSQVDSAVLTLALTLSVPLIWLPTLLLLKPETPWPFFTIGVISPLVLWFLYELVVQSQLVFGEVVRVAIDQYRLEVLTKIMRQPLPDTLAAERLLWKGLNSAAQPGNENNLSFQHKQ